MRVVFYLRRSTVDLQPDSLAAQEELLRAYAVQHGYEVVRAYSDSASGRSVQGRDAFQELIARIKSGADFDAVLVRDVSRWSRAENTDEAGYYEFVCRSHGVQVLYVEETFGPAGSPYALLLKSVKRAMAAEFSRERARMVIASSTRLVREGFWPTGSVPYGMCRVLVDGSGQVIRVLAPGDRKALASQRVKLAPGDPAQVFVVERIFKTYVLEQRNLTGVVAALDGDGAADSKDRTWTVCSVSRILRNEAYAGNLVYRIRRGEAPAKLRNLEGSPTDRIVRCEGAHQPLIPAQLWRSAQERLHATSRHRSDADLLDALRVARTQWRPAYLKPREIVTAADLREGYGRPDAEYIGKRALQAAASLLGALRPRMNVTRFEGGWLIDHLLHLGFTASLPHAGLGGLRWRFRFTGEETEDGILGLGFSPPPLVRHVETYLFRTARRRRREARPMVAAERSGEYRRITAIQQLERVLRHAIRRRSKRAERQFLLAVCDKEKVSLASVAHRLGWPVGAARTLYRKLDLRGESLPPMHGGKVAAKLRVTCPQCLRVRSLFPKVARELGTDVCFECLHRPPEHTPKRLAAVCPQCGARRFLTASGVAKRSAGLETPCLRCSLAKARNKRIAARKARKGEGR